VSDIIYGTELLRPNEPGVDYLATKLMLKGSPHKIFITPSQRDDILEGYGHGFVLEINNKRIGCYWDYDSEFEFDKNDIKIWNLDEIGIEGSYSSTNQFTTDLFFSSEEELTDALEFIRSIFNEFDGAESSTIIDNKVTMVWNKRWQCKLKLSEPLKKRIAQGRLVQSNRK